MGLLIGGLPMRELRITDGEVQALIAPAFRARLRAEGFKMGTASDADPSSFFFPINLNLAGHVEVVRGADGVWSIFQEDDAHINDRTAAASEYHGGAIAGRDQPCR